MKLNAERLKELMKRNNMNQSQLAEKVGISAASMCRYVKDGRMPRGDILVNIARELGTAPGYLTWFEDSEPSEMSYAVTRAKIRVHGKEWSKESKKRLITELLEMM